MRTPEQLREHYEIEKELADRLRHAPRAERGAMYSQVYDELFRRVPLHPQLTKQNTAAQKQKVRSLLWLLRPYLQPETIFMEIGAGDCALTLLVAPLVCKAYGLEVSEKLTGKLSKSDKFEVLISKNCDVPLPDNTVDLAFSYQVIEHIHPEDVVEQLKHIYRAIKPGGCYYCITPNRLFGPNDISGFFDREATGLHLKEYSNTDLLKLFRSIGFREVWIERRIRGRHFSIPTFPVRLIEGAFECLPWMLRTPLARSSVGRWLLSVSVMVRK